MTTLETPAARRMTLARWERITEWPLIAAAFLFLVAYAVPIIWPDLNHPLLEFTGEVIVGTWIAFWLDFLVRLALARHRLSFLKHNFIDLLSLILPILRPLRLLRLVAALAVLTRFGFQTLRGRVALYSVSFTLLLTLVAALAVTQAERLDPAGTITSFGDGLWFAFVTVATVGYGDFTPVTSTGRTVAVVLMMVGVALMGAVTASLASWLVERNAASEARAATEAQEDVSALVAQIDTLNAQAAHLSAALHHHADLLRGG